MNTFLYKLFEELNEHHLYFTVDSYVPDSIIIKVDVPGEHWEIKYVASATVKVEMFKSTDGVLGEEKLTELLKILEINPDSVLKLQTGIERLFALINQFHKGQKSFFMAMHREAEYPIMVKVNVPNEYWEIEFFESGEVVVEVFKSDGKIHGEEVLPSLIREFAD
jgi:hypothetical protein